MYNLCVHFQLLFLLLASIPAITVSGGALTSENTQHDDLEAFSSDEDYDVDNSAYGAGDDEAYDEKDVLDQDTKDARDSCQNSSTEAKMNRSEPYVCFDFSKKQMTHYLVRPAGTTVNLFCNVKGES